MKPTRHSAADDQTPRRRPTRAKSEAPQETRGPKGLPRGTLISEPLRREAERAWAESDRVASKGARRARARGKRRDVSHGKDVEIARLAGELAIANKELKRQRPGPGNAGRGG